MILSEDGRIMAKTMTFKNGMVIINGDGIPAMEPVGTHISKEQLSELMEKHGFTSDQDVENDSIEE